MSKLPPSSADAVPGKPAAEPEEAYIVNPIAGSERLTPVEALDAISILSATLLADERYRAALESRRPYGGE